MTDLIKVNKIYLFQSAWFKKAEKGGENIEPITLKVVEGALLEVSTDANIGIVGTFLNFRNRQEDPQIGGLRIREWSIRLT